MDALRQATPFGKYVLLERVSVGGMAEVFKAKSFGVEGFEKILAIKRILPSMADDADFIEMFIDEAKICGQLNHANICQIYELGRVNESHFIAMEFVWGKDVLQMQNRFRKLRMKMKPEMAAYIACKICEGLDYAHKKKDAQGKPLGIIHRDISPQNVLVSYEGELKVIDFGIAKAASRSSKTQAGVLKGKFGYMSPEQVRGLPLDRRSDIFAIGTILYEMLTAERLFYGDSDFETLEKVRNVEVVPPSQANPAVPKSLEKIIMRALSKDVETRYQWPSEMAEDLNGFLLSHDPAFTAQNLAQWMREQFAVEMKRERLVLDEQQKVTREMVAANSQPIQVTKAGTRPPQVSPAGGRATMPVRAAPSAEEHADEEDDFNEKTTVSGPDFQTVPVDSAHGALPEQSTRILDSAGPASSGAHPAPPLPGMPGQGSELAAQATVVFQDPSGQSLMPPLAGQPFGNTGVDISQVYNPNGEPSFTPHYGQLVPPAPARSSSRSTVWKDILIGVAVAAALVGGIVVARPYFTRQSQGTLVVVNPSGGGELIVDGKSRGQLTAGTPMTMKAMATGEHSIVVKSDVGEFHQATTLLAGDVNVVTAVFATSAVQTGKLKLQIEAPQQGGGYAPTTADVYVDGAQVSAEASKAPISLRAGATHEIRVVKPGHAEKKVSVDIKVGETQVHTLRLEVALGSISVTSEPSGAEVQVNGHRGGVTPTTVTELDPQKPARISIRLAGYAPVTKVVGFDKGLEQKLDFPLVAGKDVKEDEPSEPIAKTDKSSDKSEKSGKQSAKATKDPKDPKETRDPKEKTGKTTTELGKTSFPSDGLAAVSFDGGGKEKPSSQETGYLIANTQPWARVFIDGKDTGKTTPIAPRSKLEIKPGKHVITFVVSGKKYNYDINVKPGEEVRLMKQLTEDAPPP